MNKKIIRVLLVLLGLFIIGMGAGMLVYSGLGADSVSVFITGVTKQLNTSYGSIALCLNAIILIAVFFVDKKYINIASLLAVFMVGYSVDLILFILNLLGLSSIFLNYFLMFLGIISIALGTSIYIEANLGVCAVDICSEIISDNFKLPYKNVRISIDLLFFMVGFLLGGQFGIGTILSVFMIGFLIHYFREIIKKLYGGII